MTGSRSVCADGGAREQGHDQVGRQAQPPHKLVADLLGCITSQTAQDRSCPPLPLLLALAPRGFVLGVTQGLVPPSRAGDEQDTSTSADFLLPKSKCYVVSVEVASGNAQEASPSCLPHLPAPPAYSP